MELFALLLRAFAVTSAGAWIAAYIWVLAIEVAGGWATLIFKLGRRTARLNP